MLAISTRLPISIDLADIAPFAAFEADEALPPSTPQFTTPTELRRTHLMDQIMAMNPTATADFLESFDEAALSEYLRHLVETSKPRGREARWVRPDGSHGIQWSMARA